MVSQIGLHRDFCNERDWFTLFLPYKYKPALPSTITGMKERADRECAAVNIIFLHNKNVPVDSYFAGAIIILRLWNMEIWTE